MKKTWSRSVVSRESLCLALGLVVTIASALSVTAASSDVPAALGRMPVREVTVFKDGHAFVLHEGRLPADPKGDILLDQLPAPVLGTFWPYVSEPDATLVSVTASKERVRMERTALDVRSLVKANVGSVVRIDDVKDASFEATILEVPEPSAEELEATSPREAGERPAEKGSVVLLQTSSGIMAMPIDEIRRVTFKGERRGKITVEDLRNRLTLDLQWSGSERHKDAMVGMMYLERGLRWIPGYKLEIDGHGRATIKLQATIINELTDLDDVTANLVVGVPSFAFKDTPDPIALQQAMAQLGPYFESGSQTAYALSNAIMSQTARMGERVRQNADAEGAPGLGPEMEGGEREEDLYIFTMRHVSLKKGARLVLPVAEHRIEYRDVYTLDVPFLPPPELRDQVSGPQQAEIARLLEAPKVQHVLRLRNATGAPFTTAPALILARGRVLGQGLLTYTSAGGEADLTVTAAVELKVKKSERETLRTPNAYTRGGTSYARVDLAGSIAIESFDDEPADLEVTRRVLGHVDKADHMGKADMLSAFEEGLGRGREPGWWSWMPWPGWWHNANGIGLFTWKVKLAPKEKIDLSYTWHYFWP